MGHQRDQLGPDAWIARLAARQHGVLRRTQLVGGELSAKVIRQRAAAGRLYVLHRNVYSLGPPQLLSQRGRWLAAVWACGSEGALSHDDAAALWRLRGRAPGAIHVTVPRHVRRRTRAGLILHRSSLPTEDVLKLDGIPVTSVARTIIDLAALHPERSVERAIDEAQYLGRYSRKAMAATLERNARRPGSKTTRRVVERHKPGSTRTRSRLEEIFLELCRNHLPTQPAVNEETLGWEVDFLWAQERVVVETDGGAAHNRPGSRERDARKSAELTAAGYTVLRFTYDQVTRDGAWVVEQLRAVLVCRA